MKKKICRRCGDEKKLSAFRTRPSGFTLNQCRQCENEMGKERRLKKLNAEPTIITVTTKRGKMVEASVTPIEGGCMVTSPNTDKVLYFNSTIDRDTARVAFSAFAEVVRTGMKFQKL